MHDLLRKLPLVGGLLQRRRAEDTLADMASFAEMNPAPVLKLDRHGTILLVNPAAHELLAEPDLLGKSWYALCPELEPLALERVLQGNDTLRHKARMGERCILFTYRASLDRTQVHAYGADITERKQAEIDLRESDEIVHALLNATGQGIYGVDLDGNCTFANPSCVRLLGCESDQDLLGNNMHQLIHHTRSSGEPYPVEECRIYQAFREGRGVHVDDEIVWQADGTSFPAEYWSYPLYLHGNVAGCVVAFVDITEHKQAEEALRDSETMLRQSEKMAVLGTLTAGVAHELNNPAAAVKSAAGQLEAAIAQFGQTQSRLSGLVLVATQQEALQRLIHQARGQATSPLELGALARSDRELELETWLEKRGLPNARGLAPTLANLNYDTARLTALACEFAPDQFSAVIDGLVATYVVHSVLSEIGQSAGRISEIVMALKSYSYLDQTPVRAVDVHKGLDDTLLVLAHKLKSGIGVRKEYAPHLPKIQANGSELNQVWTNIIDNAADALEGQGEITIRTRQEGHQVVIEIEDDGPGIPAEVQSRIFEPFFTTKPPGLGTGLGLDISYNIIVHKHRGDIKVLSQPGKTCFQVWLPTDFEVEATLAKREE